MINAGATRRVQSIILCFMLPVIVSGCVVVPIPTPHGKILEGSEVKQSQLAFMEPKVTTKQETTERLGTPTIFWRDENIFVYRWVQRTGLLLWVAGAPYAADFGAADLAAEYAFIVKFDAGDRLEASEIATRPDMKSFGKFLLDWRDARRKEAAARDKQAP